MRSAVARVVAAAALPGVAIAGCGGGGRGSSAAAPVFVYSINLSAQPAQLGTPAEQGCLHVPGVPSGEATLGTGSGPGGTGTAFVVAVRGKRAWGNAVAACLDALPGHQVRFSNVVRDDEGLFPPERSAAK